MLQTREASTKFSFSLQKNPNNNNQIVKEFAAKQRAVRGKAQKAGKGMKTISSRVYFFPRYVLLRALIK